MPQQQNYAVQSAPVLLTNVNVSSLTFQNAGSAPVYVRATVGTTPPSASSLSGWLMYPPGTGERNVSLADLFPGEPGANRLWAVVATGNTSVLVSHA
jgi:hypothetical protein